MAPNLVSKSNHLTDSFNSGNAAAAKPTSLRTKSRVRTEFLVTNIYYYLLEDCGYDELQADSTPANSTEVEVLEAVKKIVNDFKTGYSEKIADLCGQLEVSPENVNSVFLGVLNELFSEGITWARISTIFVFSSELAAQCLHKELPESMVETILYCCLEFMQNNLENWVQDHGGWEGIVNFSEGHKSAESQLPSSASNRSWAKSVLHGTVRMFGTLAHIANNAGQIMALPMHDVRI